MTPALRWLEERLAAQGTTADEIVRDEHQRQGATNVTVRNIITSMRLISDVDWAELVRERQPRRRRAAGRQRLRGAWISRRAISTAARSRSWRAARARTELEIATRRCGRGGAAAKRRRRRRERDPGLSPDRGRARRRSSATIGFRAPLRDWPARAATRARASAAMSAPSSLVAAAVLLACRCSHWRGAGVGGGWLGAARAPRARAGDRCGGGAGQPRRHASGSARRSCPASSCATACRRTCAPLVAVPTLLTTAGRDRGADRAARGPLPREPGRRAPLRAALGLDRRGDRDTCDGDDALLDAAAAGIARLNRRYGPAPGGDRFLLLHRRRVWNEGEGSAGWAGSASAASCTS